MSIRACSRLLDVETGPAKDIYRRHRRLGVYTWREIFETAGRNPTNLIMVLRFADTELFREPVTRDFIRGTGIRSQFQSPTRIDENQFVSIYRRGLALSSP